MLCPRTQTPLKKVRVGNVPVYVSEVCGGVFFENKTLRQFECQSTKRGTTLAKHLSQFHSEIADLKRRINCPVCTDTIMLRRFYSPLHVVEIDECPGCGAIWLDTGEFEKIQALMLDEKERAILRHELMQEHQSIDVKGMPHMHDNWHKRSDKVNAFFELASYITDIW